MMRYFSNALFLAVVLAIPLGSQACGQEKILELVEMALGNSHLDFDNKVLRRVELQSNILHLQLEGTEGYKQSLERDLMKLDDLEEVVRRQLAEHSKASSLAKELEHLQADLELLAVEKSQISEQEALSRELANKAKVATALQEKELATRLSAEESKLAQLNELYESGNLSVTELRDSQTKLDVLKLQLEKVKAEAELDRSEKDAEMQKSLLAAHLRMVHLQKKKSDVSKALAALQAKTTPIDQDRINAEKAILLKKIERVHMKEVELRLQQIELDAARKLLEIQAKAKAAEQAKESNEDKAQ